MWRAFRTNLIKRILPHAQVKQVKGNNLTKGAEKVVAVAGALAAVFVILFFCPEK